MRSVSRAVDRRPPWPVGNIGSDGADFGTRWRLVSRSLPDVVVLAQPRRLVGTSPDDADQTVWV